MKTQPLLLRSLVRLGLAAGLASWTATSPVTAATDDEEFPHTVPFEVGRTRFAPGDNITIQSVRGTAAEFRTNETYCVEGVYTLNSAPEADLSLFVTTRHEAPAEIDPRQRVRVKKGSGSFVLVERMAAQGYPHVSFYPVPAGAGGGVYFGKGAWLLPQEGPRRPSDSEAAGAPTKLLSGPNRVLLEYLGEPVPPPANLEGAYTRDGLREAVQAAARKAGIATPQIVIDDSEYPLLVGVVCPEGDFDRLKTQLGKVEAYEHHGGVGGHTRHAFNLTPFRVWPPEVRERASRRLMLRMQVLHDRLNEPE